MKILISGGSGYLGRALTSKLINLGHHVVWISRNLNVNRPEKIDILNYDQLLHTNQSFDIIINLAGAGIADARWSETRKKILYDSRLKPTQAIINYIHHIPSKPKLFISGSAIGWYGAQLDNNPLTEDSAFVCNDFSHELCSKWEELALSVNKNIPVAIVRTGVVISSEGGMIGRLKLPFSLGFGGKLGNGRQIMSWISKDDWVRAIQFIIDQNLSTFLGNQQVYNLTSPKPVSNSKFTQEMGKWLGRPTVFTQPNTLLKLIFGEMSTLLIDGQFVIPQRLLDIGFDFKHQEIIEALDIDK